MSEEKQFYVYVHRKATDGSVFYVGKGKGRRAWNKHSRTNHWHYIVSKHDYTIEVVMRFDSENCAFSMERALIKYYGRENLCNYSDGGEGNSGVPSKMRKKIYCSNGMEFSSICEAADWVSLSLIVKARCANISTCANGKCHSAYGYNWSFVFRPSHPVCYKTQISNSLSTPVFCSNGMYFSSNREALKWLKYIGNEKANLSTLISSISSDVRTAYGFRWSHNVEDIGNTTSGSYRSGVLHRKQVMRSDGVLYESNKHAVASLRIEGFSTANCTHISNACRIPNRTAYGYEWRYI